MKRVKGVEDLNIRITRAQGIVGVGAIIRISIASCRVAGHRSTGRRWIGCRPGFFLPVKVLSRLYRRLFLTRLRAAFDAGQLRFFGDLASLAAPAVFATWLRPLRAFAGSFTPSDRSADPSRCSIISAAIPIASRSPTAGIDPVWWTP